MGETGCVGKVVVVDSHTIYRRGLVACLAALDEITVVSECAGVAEARGDPALADADLVLIDHELEGSEGLIVELARPRARALVCSARHDEDRVRASLRAGALGFLSKETLRPETLLAGLVAAVDGSGILAPGVLGALVGASTSAPVARASVVVELPSPLTRREHDVLMLIADGEPTREVARQLSYSERTVKNVLHDVVVKLGARSRSHAIAHAVRHGLI